MRRALCLALLLLAGCEKAAPPATPQPRYAIGQPYQMGGMWSYPKEDFAHAATGLASVMPDRNRGRRTANGEIFDPSKLVAAHRTLQLPAIVTVTNLENGLQIQVRVNDRGPVNPARLIGLSARAALLLRIPEGGAAQVRVQVDANPSRALAGQLPSTERQELAIATAPRGPVERENLAPPPGAREANRIRQGRTAPAFTSQVETTPALPPDPLPEQLWQAQPTPGRLMLDAGLFFRRDLAQQQAARIAGLRARVEQLGGGRSAEYRVLAGPFADWREADRAFGGALAVGLPEVRVVVE